MTDKRDVYFKDRLSQVFEGHGELLGGETKPSRLVPSNLNKNISNEAQNPGGTKLEEISHLPGNTDTGFS